jgi:hypothetical protein
VRIVNFKRNVLRGGTALILLVPALLAAGCGGFAASKSVSPATFLLPGLGQVEPQPNSPAAPENFQKAPEIAAVSSDLVR